MIFLFSLALLTTSCFSFEHDAQHEQSLVFSGIDNTHFPIILTPQQEEETTALLMAEHTTTEQDSQQASSATNTTGQKNQFLYMTPSENDRLTRAVPGGTLVFYPGDSYPGDLTTQRPEVTVALLLGEEVTTEQNQSIKGPQFLNMNISQNNTLFQKMPSGILVFHSNSSYPEGSAAPGKAPRTRPTKQKTASSKLLPASPVVYPHDDHVTLINRYEKTVYTFAIIPQGLIRNSANIQIDMAAFEKARQSILHKLKQTPPELRQDRDGHIIICPCCKKAYRKGSIISVAIIHFIEHMISTHTKERPYLCSEEKCEYSSPFYSATINHINRHHGQPMPPEAPVVLSSRMRERKKTLHLSSLGRILKAPYSLDE